MGRLKELVSVLNKISGYASKPSKRINLKQLQVLEDEGMASRDAYKILSNGQVAICKDSNVIVSCCSNCGDYNFIKV